MSQSAPILTQRLQAWARARPADAVLAGLFLAVVLGFYFFFPSYGPQNALSPLHVLEDSWNIETDYGHGYLVGPLMIALLGWRFWRWDPGPRDRSAWLGLLVTILGLVLWLAAYRVLQWRVAVACLPIILWGATWYTLGWRAAWAAAMPLFLLWAAIPIPNLVQATNGLQVLATNIGYHGARFFGVDCLYAGTNIQSAVAGKWGFDIAEGCSGIRSLMAMVLISAVYVYVIELPLWRKVLVFLAAIPLAILVNAIRIVTIILLAEFVSTEFAAGVYHDWASFFIFPLGLFGMLAVHQILTLDRRKKQKTVRRVRRAVASSSSSATP